MKKQPKPLWRCPKCGREFIRRTKEHSCNVSTVALHLAKTTPEAAEIFGELASWLERLEGVKITPVKTAIVFATHVNFGGVTVQKKALMLIFFLDRSVTHQRIQNTGMMGPNKYWHHVKLKTMTDFDEQVKKWLTEAHRLSKA